MNPPSASGRPSASAYRDTSAVVQSVTTHIVSPSDHNPVGLARVGSTMSRDGSRSPLATPDAERVTVTV